jgi:NADH-quinone oxidoreductase subunit L
MAIVGGLTVLVGASLAFVQDDIKKVLAYSTISQLGYMTMALGVGAWTAAIFHLFTHAFFKADLFLGAGSVSHSGSHHSFDMKKDMGGLRKYMPQTFWTFIIGSVALAGIFPLAGFWSKDEILVNAGRNGYQVFLVVGLVGAFMTAAYMTRCVYLTFFGEYRGGHSAHEVDHDSVHLDEDSEAHDGAHHGEPHESNRLITGPLWVLSAFAFFIGLLNFPTDNVLKFEHWFDPADEATGFQQTLRHAPFNPILATLSVVVALLAIGIVWAFYAGKLKAFENLSARNSLARFGKIVLVNKYYLDWLYTDVIVGGIKGPIARGAYWFNQNVIDNVLNYTGKGAAVLGRFTYNVIEQKGVDGAVNGIANVTGEGGAELRKIQNGRLQFYALMLVVAVVAFAIVLWLFT